MKKYLMRVGATLALLVLLTPLAVHAAVDRAIAEPVLGSDGAGNINVCASYMDGSTQADYYCSTFALGAISTGQQLATAAEVAVQAHATVQGFPANLPIIWQSPTAVQVNALIASATSSLATVARTGSYTDLSNLPAAPSSYQTIVSQTGTAAPAVSGGFSPMNSYSGSPTFTWARTGAGVYTLTASSAVFNTSGKTGVFIAPLQNLNASIRGTVTSSTVITVTTAVQSVAVLGLLGLTTTPTDVLLANTMIYVQTYP